MALKLPFAFVVDEGDRRILLCHEPLIDDNEEDPVPPPNALEPDCAEERSRSRYEAVVPSSKSAIVAVVAAAVDPEVSGGASKKADVGRDIDCRGRPPPDDEKVVGDGAGAYGFMGLAGNA